jgi:hypothetical protein
MVHKAQISRVHLLKEIIILFLGQRDSRRSTFTITLGIWITPVSMKLFTHGTLISTLECALPHWLGILIILLRWLFVWGRPRHGALHLAHMHTFWRFSLSIWSSLLLMFARLLFIGEHIAYEEDKWHWNFTLHKLEDGGRWHVPSHSFRR